MPLSNYRGAAQPHQPSAHIAAADIHDEPTREDILQNVRTGMRQALDGETRPAREALDEIRRKIAANADAR